MIEDGRNGLSPFPRSTSNHQGKHIANKQLTVSFPFSISPLFFSLSFLAAFYSTPAGFFGFESLLGRVYNPTLHPFLPSPLVCIHHHTSCNLAVQTCLFILPLLSIPFHPSILPHFLLFGLVGIVKHGIRSRNLRVFGKRRGIGTLSNHFKPIVRLLLLLLRLCRVCFVCLRGYRLRIGRKRGLFVILWALQGLKLFVLRCDSIHSIRLRLLQRLASNRLFSRFSTHRFLRFLRLFLALTRRHRRVFSFLYPQLRDSLHRLSASLQSTIRPIRLQSPRQFHVFAQLRLSSTLFSSSTSSCERVSIAANSFSAWNFDSN